MSDFGDMAALGFKIAGAFALVATVGLGTGGYMLHKTAVAEKVEDSLTQRINSETRAHYAGAAHTVTISSAKKIETCAKETPYGGTVYVSDHQGVTLADGTYCTAPNKATAFKFVK